MLEQPRFQTTPLPDAPSPPARHSWETLAQPYGFSMDFQSIPTAAVLVAPMAEDCPTTREVLPMAGLSSPPHADSLSTGRCQGENEERDTEERWTQRSCVWCPVELPRCRQYGGGVGVAGEYRSQLGR